MGISKNSDIVPFVVHLFWERDSLSSLPEGTPSLVDPEQFGPAQEEEDLEVGDTRGWVSHGDDVVRLGKRKRVYGWKATKGDATVYFVNESAYAVSVGEYEVAVVADDRASLEAFIEDWKDTRDHPQIKLTIEEVDTVDLYS